MNTLRPNNRRAKQVMNFILFYLFIKICKVSFGIWMYYFYRQMDESYIYKNEDVIVIILSFGQYVGIINLLSFIVFIILLIRWFRRAYWNLHQISSRRPSYSEGWAAGSWFVPFLNLARPYQIMKEIWEQFQQSAPQRFLPEKPLKIVILWWTFYIIVFLGWVFLFSLYFAFASNVGLMNNGFFLISLTDILNALLSGIFILLTYQLVKQVNEMETIVNEELENPTDSIFGAELPKN